jgi:hypothetical protein
MVIFTAFVNIATTKNTNFHEYRKIRIFTNTFVQKKKGRLNVPLRNFRNVKTVNSGLY